VGSDKGTAELSMLEELPVRSETKTFELKNHRATEPQYENREMFNDDTKRPASGWHSGMSVGKN